MVVPDSLELNSTDWTDVYEPPAGDAVIVGGVVSKVYISVWTEPRLPAVSTPKNFSVVSEETSSGEPA